MWNKWIILLIIIIVLRRKRKQIGKDWKKYLYNDKELLCDVNQYIYGIITIIDILISPVSSSLWGNKIKKIIEWEMIKIIILYILLSSTILLLILSTMLSPLTHNNSSLLSSLQLNQELRGVILPITTLDWLNLLTYNVYDNSTLFLLIIIIIIILMISIKVILISSVFLS